MSIGNIVITGSIRVERLITIGDISSTSSVRIKSLVTHSNIIASSIRVERLITISNISVTGGVGVESLITYYNIVTSIISICRPRSHRKVSGTLSNENIMAFSCHWTIIAIIEIMNKRCASFVNDSVLIGMGGVVQS